MIKDNLGRSLKTICDIETKRGFEQASAKKERVKDKGISWKGQIFANGTVNGEKRRAVAEIVPRCSVARRSLIPIVLWTGNREGKTQS